MQSPKRSNRVFVDNVGVLDSLVDDSIELPTQLRRHNGKSTEHSVSGSSINTRESSIKLMQEQRANQIHQTEIIMKNNIRKALESSREKQEKQFPILLNNVGKAQSFLDTIDKDINLFDETKKNKIRRQYEEWNTIVHGSIQKNIAKTVNSMDSKDLNRKKNQDYDQFLNITNRKPAIFRDIIIESEYDPLEPNRRCIVAKSGRLKDPVKINERKAYEEGAMLTSDGKKAPKQRLGKDMLPVEQWHAGKIDATPYGSFAKMMTSKEGSAPKPVNKLRESNVVFDHYSYPHGRAAIDAEMPRGKRIHPQTIYANPSRVLGVLPPNVEREIAQIQAPESMNWANSS